jgi:hypothetical protein
MNFYYTTDKQTFLDNIHLFCRQLGAHYIDLPDGTILLSANFPNSHYHQDAWEALPTVQALPSPLFDASTPISADQQTALAAVLTPVSDAPAQVSPTAVPVQSTAVPVTGTPTPAPPLTPAPAPTATVMDVAVAAAAINPLMKLRRF